jgi:tetratricopeptide (TPR) repeat protein
MRSGLRLLPGLALLGLLTLAPSLRAEATTATAPATPAPAKEDEVPSDAADSAFTKAYRAAFIAFKGRKYEEASTAAAKAAQLDPKDARPVVLQGRAADALGHAPEAEERLNTALLLDSQSTAAHRALGDLRLHQRRYAEARVAYLDAQRYGDTDGDLTLLLCYCAVGAKDLGEARRLFVTFNSFDEKAPRYYFAKAALARAGGNDPEARKDLQDATVLYGSAVFATYAKDYFFLFATKG